MIYEVNIFREKYIESQHLVNVSNLDSEKGFELYLRSSLKPFQLLPLVSQGGFDKFGLEDSLLALFSSSHSGEEMHTKPLLKILKEQDISEDDLYCNPHWPLNDEFSRELSSQGKAPTKIHNNCSGKHTAMLLMCKYFEFDYDQYWSKNHPLQILLVDYLSDLFQYKLTNIAIDGCGAPIPYVDSRSVVKSADKLLKEDSEAAVAWQRIISAMKDNPYLVAGTGRFDSLLMDRSNNKITAKVGAEGVIFIHSEKDTIIMKSLDGSRRGADLLALYFAREKGLIPIDLFEIEKEVIYNKQEQEVGSIEIQKYIS
tara:strand:+ start:19058 stop:19996 length:939 start_codon:yes stop_codon:yes gene_type:complete